MKTALFPEDVRRRLFPFVAEGAYLMASAETGLPQPAYEAVQRFYQDYTVRGCLDIEAWLAELDACRRAIARLLGGVDPEDVALVKNTTAGAACVAHSLPLEAGDEVWSNALEFPSNLWPFEDAARRVEAELVRLPGDQLRTPARLVRQRLLDRVDDPPRLRAIAWSWVQYREGFRADLDELGHLADEAGALLAIDGIQGVGAVPVDLTPGHVDAFYAGGHKWLLGHGGGGFLWVRPGALEGARSFGRGWLSATDPMAMDLDGALHPGARRFEDGNLAFAAFYALRASVELLLEVGVEEVWLHIQHLQDHLLRQLQGSGWQRVSSVEPGSRGPILGLQAPGWDVAAVAAALAERNIWVTARDGVLRVAPHLYNTIEEMDALARALR